MGAAVALNRSFEGYDVAALRRQAHRDGLLSDKRSAGGRLSPRSQRRADPVRALVVRPKVRGLAIQRLRSNSGSNLRLQYCARTGCVVPRTERGRANVVRALASEECRVRSNFESSKQAASAWMGSLVTRRRAGAEPSERRG